MPSRPTCWIMAAAALALSACGRPSADQIAVNGAVASDAAIEDADTRGDHLAEEALLLNAQAARTTGTHRRMLENEATNDLSAAMDVEQQGQVDADDIAAATDKKIAN